MCLIGSLNFGIPITSRLQNTEGYSVRLAKSKNINDNENHSQLNLWVKLNEKVYRNFSRFKFFYLYLCS